MTEAWAVAAKEAHTEIIRLILECRFDGFELQQFFWIGRLLLEFYNDLAVGVGYDVEKVVADGGVFLGGDLQVSYDGV